ncbi:MAG: DUF5668 domain-containing protein [Patescibacteria group bacterium]|jgi:predicted membrane protein
MEKRGASLFIPIALIIIGIGWLISNLGAKDFGQVFGDWWPVLFMIGAALTWYNNKKQVTGPLIFMALGLFLLLSNLNVVTGNVWNYFWPIIIIIIGFSIINNRRGSDHKGEITDDARIFTAFGGQERYMDGKDFNGGEITAIFGGVDLDLRKAVFTKDADIQILAAFGGVDILVPKNLKVEVSGIPIFGGFGNKAHLEGSPIATLRIHGTVVFGGVDIKNEKV